MERRRGEQSPSQSFFPSIFGETSSTKSSTDMSLRKAKYEWVASFINLLPDATCLVDRAGNVHYANAEFSSLFSLPRESPLNFLTLVHERDKSDVELSLDNSYAQRAPVSLQLVRCFALHDRDAHTLPIPCALIFNRNDFDDLVLLIAKCAIHSLLLTTRASLIVFTCARPNSSKEPHAYSHSSKEKRAPSLKLSKSKSGGFMVEEGAPRVIAMQSISGSTRSLARTSSMTSLLQTIQESRLSEAAERQSEAAEQAAGEADMLRAKLALKSMFVRSVSHEIRTPLYVVFSALTWLELEAQSTGLREEVKATIAMTKEACSSAVDLLNDMLAYEKIDGNILSLEAAPLDMRQFIRDCANPFMIPAAQKHVSLTVESEGGGEELLISADEYKLHQVVRNLLSNALKFTLPQGHVRVRVCTVLRELDANQSEWVRVEVIDSGYGIAKENLGKLFREIIQFSAKEQQKGGGSGLGLYISKGIVELHSGVIGVESEGLGLGCTFFIEFRRVFTSQTEVDIPRSLSTSSANNGSVVGRDVAATFQDLAGISCSALSVRALTCAADPVFASMRVLIVDDSLICRRVLKMLFSKFHITCEEAEDGLVAVNKTRESMVADRPYDGVFMDVEMPEMNGIEATGAMRELGFAGRIYGCTGNASKEVIESFMSNGADKIFLKPPTDKDFKSILRGTASSCGCSCRRITLCICADLSEFKADGGSLARPRAK